jgi:hypothetical protein
VRALRTGDCLCKYLSTNIFFIIYTMMGTCIIISTTYGNQTETEILDTLQTTSKEHIYQQETELPKIIKIQDIAYLIQEEKDKLTKERHKFEMDKRVYKIREILKDACRKPK